MKVLFAVSNEEISESIVKKYQKEYKQIISYKNVYYFNAILKELQKDKTYDRVVISEDLESFTHTQYDQIDKFIFEKLDSISDEASNAKGSDMPIIVICSDRRTKSETMLVKLFGIGIYDAIIGNDRSIDEVCRLINRPRTKKEAKVYYKIDSEDVGYQAENENDVSEMEIQNIVAHYKRLGKDESRYIDSFNNIAAQYNDTQLRIISKFLPLNVRAILEEKSQKYQQIMSFNNSVSDTLRKTKEEIEDGPSEILLKSQNKGTILSKPVVIPSAVNMSGTKKLAKHRTTTEIEEKVPVQKQEEEKEEQDIPLIEGLDDFEDFEEVEMIPEKKVEQVIPEEVDTIDFDFDQEEPIRESVEEKEEVPEAVQPVKRGRGRPRKNPVPVVDPNKPKRGRGRPRKNPIPVIEESELLQEEMTLPGLETQEIEKEDNFLPGFSDIDETIEPQIQKEWDREEVQETSDSFLPGFEEETLEEPEQEEMILPGFEESEAEIETRREEPKVEARVPEYHQNIVEMDENLEAQENYEEIDITNLLTSDKKIATFVGTSKNGTSFIVNNVAELLSSMGVNVAILDTTKNRNSYYIYTKNEEPLREIATHCIEKLAQGVAEGIKVNQNLTVYTSLPDEEDAIYHVDQILASLLQKHSLILIDTDFDTPLNYFKHSQETYLVQSMDILTIQPLTAFLRELKARNILEEAKLRIVLNKVVKIRGIKAATIIGGMAFYNDPAMSFMTELFDKDRVKYVSMPFEEETYIKYLQGIIECEVSLKGYSKVFLQTLRELGNMVYPIVTTVKNNKNYQPPSVRNNSESNFSSSMNDTLDRMRRF